MTRMARQLAIHDWLVTAYLTLLAVGLAWVGAPLRLLVVSWTLWAVVRLLDGVL